jgi:hypothetical protein
MFLPFSTEWQDLQMPKAIGAPSAAVAWVRRGRAAASAGALPLAGVSSCFAPPQAEAPGQSGRACAFHHHSLSNYPFHQGKAAFGTARLCLSLGSRRAYAPVFHV